jgi:hypothetical protein
MLSTIRVAFEELCHSCDVGMSECFPGRISLVGWDVLASAGKFAQELIKAGHERELVRLMLDFKNLGSEETRFEQRRREVVDLLNTSMGRSKDDPKCKSVYSESELYDREFDPREAPDGMPLGWITTSPNPDLVFARLLSMNWLLWNLPTALKDTQRLLKSRTLNQEARSVLQEWKHEILATLHRSDREHLFGSSILWGCWQCWQEGPVSNLTDYRLRRSTVFPYASTRLRKAAEHLCTFAGGEAANIGSARTCDPGHLPEKEPSQTKSDKSIHRRKNTDWENEGIPWCHSPDEVKPAEYQYGPLSGSLDSVAKQIIRGLKYGSDRRVLRKLARKGYIYNVRNGQDQYIRVYFKSREMWEQIEAARPRTSQQ